MIDDSIIESCQIIKDEGLIFEFPPNEKINQIDLTQLYFGLEQNEETEIELVRSNDKNAKTIKYVHQLNDDKKDYYEVNLVIKDKNNIKAHSKNNK